jgi:hypothetical protein
VATEITVYPVPTHAFHVFWTFLPEAINALEDAGQFTRGRLAGTYPFQSQATAPRPEGGVRARS